eukprot:CAMPEP_0113563556 /NCGR_PEP_ID=MMETSP0015_2-20120614/21134_1 /TAXON_ID=2838 /ORGANISM="Odontella" /LENGTH=434 /DNA_ID=CAMNT_0000465549 /DNA_START=49 /DNA_END=1350 /DNA_ORIENTATION=- /assembly_acc=CAM_ASM_000160
MLSIITASPCDSRSCNQTGGGEYLKSDIEDLISLLPPPSASASSDDAVVGRGRQSQRGARKKRPAKSHQHKQHRVVLTTCFGLCNHSPNIQLKSSGGPPSLRARRGKLVNDGGLRQRMDTTDATTDDDVATDTAMISNATISKVALAIGLCKYYDTDAASTAVRALECQSQGNKCQRNKRFEDALECYLEGRQELLLLLQLNDEVDDEAIDGGRNNELKLQSVAINKLYSKMILSCARMRIQWATELMTMNDTNDGRDGDEKKEEASPKMMLELAAGDAICVLLKSLKEEEAGKEDGGATDHVQRRVQRIITEIVHCSTAGLQTYQFLSNDEGCAAVRGSSSNDGEQEISSLAVPSLSRDIAIIVQFCVVLADTWKGQAAIARRRCDDNYVTNDGNDSSAHAFTNRALVAYKGALDIVLSSEGRVLRMKERRRI